MAKQNGYGIAATADSFVWGSNMPLEHNAMTMLLGIGSTPSTAQINIAKNHFDFLLGRNPNDQCFITGLGFQSVRNPHHRLSVGDKIAEPIPGLIAGGPNKDLSDPAMTNFLSGNAPAARYIDNVDSYATNEITTYWNAAALYVAAYFSLNP